MPLIRCIRKLLTEIGAQVASPADQAHAALLGDWFAEQGQTVIGVDDRELSLEEFGRLLTTYAGWGMRIEFTPDDETGQRPRLEVRDPDEPGASSFC